MTSQTWFPTINLDECNGCDGAYKCVTYCPHGVLATHDDQVVVVQPLKCINGCSACAGFCPQHAILFPSKAEPSRLTKKKSLLHQVVCRGCGKHFSTDREIHYCFDCETQYNV